MTASHKKPRLPFFFTPTGTRTKRWYIDTRDTHDDFVIIRFLGDGELLRCRRPRSCRFTLADRRKLIARACERSRSSAQLAVAIVSGNEVIDFAHQLFDAAEGAAPDRLVGDQSKEALDRLSPAPTLG